MFNHFRKGVNFRDPRLTKSPRIWWKYFWWCIYTKLRPNLYLPLWFRVWYARRTGKGIIAWPVLNRPYLRIVRFAIRQKGEFSHRCEFTDKQDGALYGGTSGGFMNELFNQFVKNISTDSEEE